MTIRWTLRHKLAVEHHIFAAPQLRDLIREKAGTTILLPELEQLMDNDPPAEARVSTLQAICNTLGCTLSAFCDITADRTPASPDSA